MAILFSSQPLPPRNSLEMRDTPFRQSYEESKQRSDTFSYFKDIKASLRADQDKAGDQNDGNDPVFPSLRKPQYPLSASRPASEKKENLSLQEIYKQGFGGKSDGRIAANESRDSDKNIRKLSFEAIRETLGHLRSRTRGHLRSRSHVSSGKLPDWVGGSYKLGPEKSELSERGMTGFPKSMNSELEDKEAIVTSEEKSIDFVKIYTYKELGQKLIELRQHGKTKEGKRFSLEELRERLEKLREMEEKETGAKIAGIPIHHLRDSIVKLKNFDEEKARKHQLRKLNLLKQFDSQVVLPTKEHLLARYVNPENLSASAKLRIRLARVRHEFKIHESDCGSTPVQVAQLSTRIQYLSSVLHKKDKHNRRALQLMVEKRRKLLKYLKRTDFESYSSVIGRLGIRDNIQVLRRYQYS